MRILKVTQTYYPYLSKGGPPAKVRAIARALAQRGHDVTVLTADRGEANGASHAASIRTNAARSQSEWGWELAEGGVRAIYLPTLKSYRATTVNPRVWSFCARQLPNYDMVHIYGLYDLLGSVIGWFCRRRGIPYVLEPLGMFGPKIRSQRKKNLYRKLIGNSLFAGAHSLIATSEHERSELIAGGIDESKIVLRRNGININEYETLPRRGQFRAKHGIGIDKPLIVFIGRLSFIKALDLLVKAFAQLDSDAYLVIAGPDDEDGCAREIQELIEEFQLQRQVILTGPLYNNEKLQAFVDADFVVLPSRYESFGNVAAESIACGTPVLVTDQCGIASMVDGKAGLVVPCNAKSLQQGMKLLMEDKLLLARLRGRCAEAAQDLSWDEPIAATEKLYEFLIARHDARVPRALTAKGDRPIET